MAGVAGTGSAVSGAGGWRWEVALSFAGAQRGYVERVARALAMRGVRCFYDADEQIDLWGRHLAEELPRIYAEDAATVVVFLSAEYAARDWTNAERRAALSRAVRERREFVLPARFDDTVVPGLLSDLVAVDLRVRTPEEFAVLVARKLASLGIAVSGGDGETGPEAVALSAVGSPAVASVVPVRWRPPAELVGFLRMMRQVTDRLPRSLRGEQRSSLSGLYVRQTVSAAGDARRVRDDSTEDVPWVEQDRRVRGLAQPFEEVADLHDHLVIEGAAGLGKTTLGYQLAGRLVQGLLEPEATLRAPVSAVPLVVPARVLAAHMHRGWGAALQASVAGEYDALADGPLPVSMFTDTVGGLPWLIVVDALDEIPEQASREKLLGALAARMSVPDGSVRFLVTTRPLPPGETVLLAGPRVGFYELQPFDAEALSRFAYRWFDPAGTAAGGLAAREFLDQVETAGLGDILKVPLLAALAAQVHESRADEPLPASRFELYERYSEHLARTRAAAGSAVLEPLRREAGGVDLADWLETHRGELLEQLATTYTTVETPLLEVAQRFLVGHAPLPTRLPADWTGMLAEWLAHTGLLARQGARLRFLHQMFAEHLAATAAARVLPETYDPDRPPWDELIRRLVLDDETGTRTLLHYLHDRGPGAALLTGLQHGSRDQRDHAADLISQGAPCDSAQLDASLAHVEERVLVGAWGAWRLRGMAGLTRHRSVCDWLRRLLAHDAVTPHVKITIVGLLRGRAADAQQQGIALLTGWTAEAQPPSIRRAAAAALARFGGEHHVRAVAVFHGLATDPSGDPNERIQAAEQWAQLGGEQRTRAAGALYALAVDPAAEGWHRHPAARALADLGGEQRTRAADALCALAADPAIRGWVRCRSAETLADLGGEQRTRAADALCALAADPTVGRGDQAHARAAAAGIKPELRSQAATALEDLATDPTAGTFDRYRAARELAELGAAHRARAVDALFTLASEPTDTNNDANWLSRVFAAEELTKRGDEGRRRAVTALHHLVTNRTDDRWGWSRAVQELTKLGGEYPDLVVDALHGLMIDPTRDAGERRDAALNLVKIGGDHARRVRDITTALLDDPAGSPVDQILAATVLGITEPGSRALAAATIRHIADGPAVDARTRLQAAHALADMGPATVAAAAGLFRQLAIDPSLASGNRIDAALALAERGGDCFADGAAILHALAGDPTLDADERRRGAEELAQLGGEHHAHAAGILQTLATDRTLDADSRRWAAATLAGLGGEYYTRAGGILQ
ncbi:TIR domain-containing protein, partial [Frankia sp. Cj3]|uniref:TIR domain-containing protein n=1 Tax=Frankia sp. Cj3 TaxID=2880976 RepID=UPI001EF6D8D7